MIVNGNRYKHMIYRKVGSSGLVLPIISLGLWNNFSDNDDYELNKEIILYAFNSGITHFDLANNYGPPPGHAEKVFGKILEEGLNRYRDEIIISTKAGYDMWDGPYQIGGSRKYLMSSIDQSLKRLNLDYVDIFYHHVPDKNTPVQETMRALADIVKSGKALYIGLSNYNSEQTKEASKYFEKYDIPYIIGQPSYSMINRWIEKDNYLQTQQELGAGTICFSVLAQGLLSNKYIDDIPEKSRVANKNIESLNEKSIPNGHNEMLKELKEIADIRGETISELALIYVLNDINVSSALMGIRTIEQLRNNLKVVSNYDSRKLSSEELELINKILVKYNY